jgi:hypothetical protein
MCIACEMAFLIALEDGVPPSTGVASHDKPPANDAPRFVCDAPEDASAKPAALATRDERKPIVTSRE